MPLFNFGRGDNFCNTLIQFQSPEMLFPISLILLETGMILGRLGIFGVLGNYEAGAWHGWQRDTISNYRCISGDFWLSITFRSLRTPPRSAADLSLHRKHEKTSATSSCHLFSGRKWKCTSVAASFIQFGQKTFHRSSVPICRNIYYLLVLMNETFCWTMFLINILINYGYLKCHVEMSFLFIFSIWSKYLSGSQSLDR